METHVGQLQATMCATASSSDLLKATAWEPMYPHVPILTGEWQKPISLFYKRTVWSSRRSNSLSLSQVFPLLAWGLQLTVIQPMKCLIRPYQGIAWMRSQAVVRNCPHLSACKFLWFSFLPALVAWWSAFRTESGFCRSPVDIHASSCAGVCTKISRRMKKP